jgi:hypothetical protein
MDKPEQDQQTEQSEEKGRPERFSAILLFGDESEKVSDDV